MAARNAAALASAIVVLALPSAAAAQLGVSVSLATDTRLRGLSLTDLRPSISLGLNWDQPDGVYAGATLLSVADGSGTRFVGHSEYLGFTHPLGEGRSLDAGVSNLEYDLQYGRRFGLRYSEVYLGVVERDIGAHIYFAPNYPRQGVNSAYIDVNASHRIAEVWRLSAHLGAHERLAGYPARDGRRWRVDTQLGVAREFTKSELDLTWTASAPDPLPHPTQSRPGVALAAKYFF